MTNNGPPAIGGLCGLLLGLFLAVDLLLFGTIRLDSALVVILPIVLLVVGVVAGLFAPLTMLRR